jgi:hypothetical protein
MNIIKANEISLVTYFPPISSLLARWIVWGEYYKKGNFWLRD